MLIEVSQAAGRKLTDTNYICCLAPPQRGGPDPSSVKLYATMFNPGAKISSCGFGLTAPNPFILTSLNPGEAWVETSAL